MIAIPNMEKPKDCWDCFNYDCDHWGEHGYDNTLHNLINSLNNRVREIYNQGYTQGYKDGYNAKQDEIIQTLTEQILAERRANDD